MKTKLIANKVTIIVVLIVFVVVCIGIGALIAPNSEKTGDSSVSLETEQNKDDATNSDDKTDEEADKKENNSAGLEVHETYDNNTEDKSDASGNWDDTTKSEGQTSNTNSSNKEEEILKDDINWGEIY